MNDTKDRLPADTTKYFYSSEHRHTPQAQVPTCHGSPSPTLPPASPPPQDRPWQCSFEFSPEGFGPMACVSRGDTVLKLSVTTLATDNPSYETCTPVIYGVHFACA
jgi:hypothetical protein